MIIVIENTIVITTLLMVSSSKPSHRVGLLNSASSSIEEKHDPPTRALQNTVYWPQSRWDILGSNVRSDNRIPILSILAERLYEDRYSEEIERFRL